MKWAKGHRQETWENPCRLSNPETREGKKKKTVNPGGSGRIFTGVPAIGGDKKGKTREKKGSAVAHRLQRKLQERGSGIGNQGWNTPGGVDGVS